MNDTDSIVAAAEGTASSGLGTTRARSAERNRQKQDTFTTEVTEAHRENQNPHTENASGGPEKESTCQEQDPLAYLVDAHAIAESSWEERRERRVYRGRTINMLRQYMRYSHETGRLPSLLGREFFRAKVTAYTVVTFEDRVIFVHDMETCLEKLDEFSRQLIARHILQEHDLLATARLLGCSKSTVQRYVPIALDLLSEILLDLGLLERISPAQEKSCQEGGCHQNSVSDCETSENKFQKLTT